MYIVIIVAPEITIPPDNITVNNGTETVLNCTVVGDPLPSISWFVVSGVNLSLLFSIGLMTPFDQQGRINDIAITNTVLNSTSIHSSVRLMETASYIASDYACSVSNSLGNINRTATLTVHGKWTNNYILCDMLDDVCQTQNVWLKKLQYVTVGRH